MATPIIVADFETQLSSAIAVGGTSFTLSSIIDDDGVSLPGGLYYFTLDNGSSVKEYLTGTLSGSTVSTVKSVSRQGVETTGAARAHRVGASVIITDFATYKKYIDNIAIAGTVAATPSVAGIAKLSAVAANASDPVVVASTDSRIPQNSYAASIVGTDAYAITLTTAPAAYATGQQFTFKADVINTGTATLNVNSLGAISILRGDGSALADSDIAAGQVITVVYDGTAFRLNSPRLGSTNPTRQTFTASGTYTAPAGLKYARVRLVGAGANGGSTTSSSGGQGLGPGGSPGGYSEKLISAATIGASQTVTIGTNAGTRTTSFGAIMSATGGTDVASNTPLPGAPGVGTGGDINTSSFPAGGGFSGNSSGISMPSGYGGSTVFGTGARGVNTQNTNGNSAPANTGAGGSGADAHNAGGGASGGQGADGFLEVIEYYN